MSLFDVFNHESGTAKVTGATLRVERMDNGKRILLRPLIVDLGQVVPGISDYAKLSRKKTQVITVPTGFDTDYSSIPRFARSIMGRWDKHDIAGIVHDWLYRVGAPRDAADTVWRIVATSGDRHVNRLQGFLGWLGLRVGAGAVYKRIGKREGWLEA